MRVEMDNCSSWRWRLSLLGLRCRGLLGYSPHGSQGRHDTAHIISNERDAPHTIVVNTDCEVNPNLDTAFADNDNNDC